jgi:hypothetical protein
MDRLRRLVVLLILATTEIALSGHGLAAPIEVSSGLIVDFSLLNPQPVVTGTDTVAFEGLLSNSSSSTQALIGSNVGGTGFNFSNMIFDPTFGPNNPYSWAGGNTGPTFGIVAQLQNIVVQPGASVGFTWGTLVPNNPPVAPGDYSNGLRLGVTSGFCCQFFVPVDVTVVGDLTPLKSSFHQSLDQLSSVYVPLDVAAQQASVGPANSTISIARQLPSTPASPTISSTDLGNLAEDLIGWIDTIGAEVLDINFEDIQFFCPDPGALMCGYPIPGATTFQASVQSFQLLEFTIPLSFPGTQADSLHVGDEFVLNSPIGGLPTFSLATITSIVDGPTSGTVTFDITGVTELNQVPLPGTLLLVGAGMAFLIRRVGRTGRSRPVR